MAKDDKPHDAMDYDLLQKVALRGVIRAALERAAAPGGLPGDHHFYISFRTDFEAVSIPPDLRARYPEEMTIVLQNQFWDLRPGEEAFSVTLQFNGQPKSLAIPYAAVTRFYDPSVHFLLQFAPTQPTVGVATRLKPAPAPTVKGPGGGPARTGADGEGPKVVALDQFRKK